MPDSSVPAEGAGAQSPAPSGSPSLAGPLAAALCYAGFGWGVFPAAGVVGGRCSCGRADCDRSGKHPLTRHGLRDATTDQDQLARWWRRWPDANVAIATGDIVVIDIDPASGGWESLARLVDGGWTITPTATVITGGGGAHLYYQAPAGSELRNTVGRLPGVADVVPGIDLRGAGGYVIAPPSRHASGGLYRWVARCSDLVEVPDWLRPPPPHPRGPVVLPCSSTSSSAYGQAALRDELARIGAATPGTRNSALNTAAFCLGQLVGGGSLVLVEALTGLFDAALAVGLSEAESRRTIESGIKAGRRLPRRGPQDRSSPRGREVSR